MCAVKATGMGTALRVAEIERPSEGVRPKRQPLHQISRSFNDDGLSCWPSEVEAELAEVGGWGEDPRCGVSFPNRVEVKIRHVKVAGAVHGHAVGIAKS